MQTLHMQPVRTRPFGAAQPRQQQAPRRAHAARRAVRVAASVAGAVTKRPTEGAAKAAFLAANPDTMDSCLALLKNAATTKGVQPELVEGALVWLEDSVGGQSSGVESIDGSWRLVFSTSTSIRFFQYIPVKEDLIVDTSKGAISLESEVGPFRFVIGGAIGGWRAAAGELDFQFKQVDILLFGNKIWTVTPATKPKTYTFFFVGNRVSAARSSAGGLSLLLR
ncbi:MAG: hypothetical protein J3K34DRAFT_22794 [Monoraphidium minutum]|nr:MAG: hypothetical protein J3K34DRAFT_22794 [Monoraphidium minutum]